MQTQQYLFAINGALLLAYTIWDIAIFWNSPAHGSPPPGFCTAFISIAHSAVLAVIFLVLSLFRKKQIAQLVLRQSMIIIIAGIAMGIILAGIWILNG